MREQQQWPHSDPRRALHPLSPLELAAHAAACRNIENEKARAAAAKAEVKAKAVAMATALATIGTLRVAKKV